MYNIIVACTKEGGIGNDGGIPWHFGEDLKRFKTLTMGCDIIMGRKTWESIPIRPLPGRNNIVVSSNSNIQEINVMVASSLQEALSKTKNKVFVIGGSSLYNEAIRDTQCTSVYLTQIKNNYKCDTFIDISYLKLNYSVESEVDCGEFTYSILHRNPS